MSPIVTHLLRRPKTSITKDPNDLKSLFIKLKALLSLHLVKLLSTIAVLEPLTDRVLASCTARFTEAVTDVVRFSRLKSESNPNQLMRAPFLQFLRLS